MTTGSLGIYHTVVREGRTRILMLGSLEPLYRDCWRHTVLRFSRTWYLHLGLVYGSLGSVVALSIELIKFYMACCRRTARLASYS